MGERVALVSGGWGQNVGNAFFNLGGRHLLTAAGADVTFVQDMPAYATFRNEARGNYRNWYSVLEHLDVTMVVLQGPCFTVNIGNIWRPTLLQLERRGIRWAALGAAFRNYTDEERTVALDLIADHPPAFISTRDEASCEGLREARVPVRSGIDSAFFVPEVFSPHDVPTQFVTFAFDHFAEPRLIPSDAGAITIGDRSYRPSPRRLHDAAARRSKAHAIAFRMASRRDRLPAEVNGYTVVRPSHRTNPHLPITIYKNPNAVASDEPWTYLTLYGNTSLTFSDRVHACVATLAYGNPAMLHNPTTRRSALFEAVGCSDVRTRPVRLCDEVRRTAGRDTIDFLAGHLG